MLVRLLEDHTIETLLVPSGSLLLLDAVREADTRLAALAAGDTRTRAGHAHEEVHTENTDTGVVLDAEIDVLSDTEAEVAGLGEVAAAELVLLHLETTLNDLLGLGTTDGDVARDLFVTADTEPTQGVAGLAGDRGLTGKLFQHLGRTSQTIARLADRDVDDELVNLELL